MKSDSYKKAMQDAFSAANTGQHAANQIMQNAMLYEAVSGIAMAAQTGSAMVGGDGQRKSPGLSSEARGYGVIRSV